MDFGDFIAAEGKDDLAVLSGFINKILSVVVGGNDCPQAVGGALSIRSH